MLLNDNCASKNTSAQTIIPINDLLCASSFISSPNENFCVFCPTLTLSVVIL